MGMRLCTMAGSTLYSIEDLFSSTIDTSIVADASKHSTGACSEVIVAADI